MSDSDAVDSSLSETSASSPSFSPPAAEKEHLNSVTAEELQLGADRKDRRRKLPLWSRESIEAAAYDRDRMSYEHMLVRYGAWSNVRGHVLAYTVLTVIAFVYKSHCDFIDLTETMHTVEEGRHIHCCCQLSERSCYLKEQAYHFHSGGYLEYAKYVGRRTALMVTVLTGFLCSLLLMFSHPKAGIQAIHIMLSLCVASVMMISMANLTEMLPYRLRFLAVSIYVFASGITNSIASLHFYFGFSFPQLAVISGLGYFGGIFIVASVIRDSICHLNIRNEADEVEELIRQEEMRLLDANPDAGIYYHNRVARKIFEDLVYLDRDELKLINFLKRLWRNSIMLEIAIALFQSISAALHEYEFGRFWSDQFRGPYLVQVDRITGYFLAFMVMLLLRKVHRVKALAYVFAVSLLISGVRRASVVFDKHNGCADIDLIETKYYVFSSILSILLHFLETTPSILRLTAPMIVYLPMYLLFLVYTYHIIIIIVTLVRSKSALPYSLYMFDLMPVSEKEPESEREDSEDEEALLVPARNTTSMVVCGSRKKNDLDGSSKGFDPIARLERMITREPEEFSTNNHNQINSNHNNHVDPERRWPGNDVRQRRETARAIFNKAQKAREKKEAKKFYGSVTRRRIISVQFNTRVLTKEESAEFMKRGDKDVKKNDAATCAPTRETDHGHVQSPDESFEMLSRAELNEAGYSGGAQ
ncbi:hypothetical protein PRIPAC_88826 [Pristionchus pacificus]|uniref:Uncharacterized protein n=1 Tax=Pristionchus pacificus TaxID=54126 RepID=A0A2A6B7N3_PRIPA|nr:hypothetical protein PRIPAC_88826 [Pristionchus pacificus]|eukprot:PDM61899.1 hypothetical protein PRIPAC_51341 [Pristionchus pacificus]